MRWTSPWPRRCCAWTSAVSLLGSRAVLAGIRAELAATLVRIGVNLSGMASCATLQSAIEWALAERGLSIQPLATARLPPAAATAPLAKTIGASDVRGSAQAAPRPYL